MNEVKINVINKQNISNRVIISEKINIEKRNHEIMRMQRKW